MPARSSTAVETSRRRTPAGSGVPGGDGVKVAVRPSAESVTAPATGPPAAVSVTAPAWVTLACVTGLSKVTVTPPPLTCADTT